MSADATRVDSADRDYLSNPDYFRMSYQLVAQEANHAALAKVSDMQRTQTAERLAGDIDQALSSFEFRQRVARWRPWEALDVPELRLQRFLAGTVEPCTLLILTANRSPDPADPLEVLRPVRPRAREILTYKRFTRSPIVGQIEWSYRAYYNLACSRAEVLRRVQKPVGQRAGQQVDGPQARLRDGALSALARAFRAVHGRPRTELWRWAHSDPSLASIRADPFDGERFAQVLREFAPPGTTQPGRP